MAQKTVIRPSTLPPAPPMMSRGIRVGDLVFVAGTAAATDPATGKMDPDIRVQVRSTLETIQTVLEAAGTSLSNAVSVLTHLKDRSQFDAYNEEYVKFFPVDPPCRTTVQCELIRLDMLIEITVVAAMPS